MFDEDYTFCDNIIDDEDYGIAEMETTKSRVRSMIDWINKWYSVTSQTVAIIEDDFYTLKVFSKRVHYDF